MEPGMIDSDTLDVILMPVSTDKSLIEATRTGAMLRVDDLPLDVDWHIDSVTDANTWIIRARWQQDIEWFDVQGPVPIRNPLTGMPINVWHRTRTQVYRVTVRRADGGLWSLEPDGKIHTRGCKVEFEMETIG